MSFIGGPIEASLAQLAQAQRSAAEGRDRERAASESARRSGDSVMLKVAGLEHPSAVRSTENDDLEKKRRRRSAMKNAENDDSGEDGGSPDDRDSLDIRA